MRAQVRLARPALEVGEFKPAGETRAQTLEERQPARETPAQVSADPDCPAELQVQTGREQIFAGALVSLSEHQVQADQPTKPPEAQQLAQQPQARDLRQGAQASLART